jgi:hypothetical protein
LSALLLRVLVIFLVIARHAHRRTHTFAFTSPFCV